jgi:nucleotide-binding universal stress UspA family protein
VFRKILLPLDGSVNAEGAIPWVTQLAAASGTPVVLVRVLDKVYPLEGMPFGAEADEARVYLEAVARTLSKLGIPTEIVLPSDPAAEGILSSATKTRCNLIVMTTRGTSRLVRRLVGGTTEQIVRISPVPVLVVPSSGSSRPHSGPARILVPVDGSPGTKQVLAWAERLAQLHGVPVEILYVRPGRKSSRTEDERRAEEFSRELGRMCRWLLSRGIRAVYRLEQGDPAEEILKACRASDLVVMTTHGFGGLRRLVRGSVAERVIHAARGPVFISKHGPKARKVPERPAKRSQALGAGARGPADPKRNGNGRGA